MQKFLRLVIVAVGVLSMVACGGEDRPSVFVAQIFSDQQADGDIAFDPVLSSYTITNGPSTVYFGIDQSVVTQPEYRAFLDFPLNGSTGGGVVPAGARIRSATIDLFINEVSFATTVPTLIDLVQYPISGLRAQDFDSSPLAFRSLNFFASDQGNFVAIDVTPLLVEARRLGLVEFQLRFLLDFVPRASGLVGIEDLPGVTFTAPLLIVEYE